MKTRMPPGPRLPIAALLAALLTAGGSGPALASEPETDPRWLPWMGCWTPTGATEDAAPSLAGVQHLCVMPVPGAAGVDLVSVADGRIISRVHIDAAGARRPVSRDGCEGWERAEWSAGGARVYLRSELACAGGVERISSSVIAMSSPSDWVDVQVVAVRDQRSTRIVRYRSARDTTALAREISVGLADRELARQSARMAASALPTVADVIEASSKLEPAVVEAWLLQRMPRFAIDARDLRQLSRAHVHASVIDLVVALSRPETFPERLAARGYTFVRIEPPRPAVVALALPAQSQPVYVMPSSPGIAGAEEGYSSGHRHYDGCGHADVYVSYYGRYPYSPYGLSPYWPYGLYPYYPYNVYYPSPRPVTPRPRDPVRPADPRPRPEPGAEPRPAPPREPAGGRAVRGQGYTRSTGGGTATPAPPPREASARPRAVPAAEPAAKPIAKPTAKPATETEPARPTRTAKPRPPGAA